ncbi:hypothetical protein [Snodgrassella sp. CFCC 13594]|jgi:cyanate lyase|uniref:hypothetical protein n=1 Tax=Snodgrassella sp. CFCC 13594 TaxID=1775559 RepID=UPI00082D1483|nr:hypothetical protein [Snodgrassella sp. CFCC 13594]
MSNHSHVLDDQQKLLLAIKNNNKANQCQYWQALSAQAGFSNEWTVAARLGQPAYTDEQAHMVASLFGRC